MKRLSIELRDLANLPENKGTHTGVALIDAAAYIELMQEKNARLEAERARPQQMARAA
jgi:hypothetical protein